MFDIGGGELILIILGIIVLFGPEKLPEIVKLLGKGMSKIREAQSQIKTQLGSIQEELTNATEVNKTDIDNVVLEVNESYENIDSELFYTPEEDNTTANKNKLNTNKINDHNISVIDNDAINLDNDLKI